MSSISLACNFYREENAMPGLLENASAFFDDFVMLHCPPAGVNPNDDPTLDILRKWGIPWKTGTLEHGFGAARTQLIRETKTDWLWISDADERFYPMAPALTCEGTEGYPQFENPSLTVYGAGGVYDQGKLLREMMRTDKLSILVSRRHWFDFTWSRPCQNWDTIPDPQCRCVRAGEYLVYHGVMHEGLKDLRTGRTPEHNKLITGPGGLFIDHYHCHFKAMEKEQRAQDIAAYDALHEDSTKEMWGKIQTERDKINE